MTETESCIVLGGVRGSLPLSHPDFARYGGATTSVLLDDGAGGQVLLDAGTGLRILEPLVAPGDAAASPVLLLFTHYHLDHLMGLPPFGPLYDPAWRAVVAAPAREGVTAEAAVRTLTSPPFWPAPFRAQLRFLTLDARCAEPLRHGPFDVRWCAVHHANGCHAYRVDARASGRSAVFATDLEWGRSGADERDALLRLCREPAPADVLIMEGHDDTASRDGWGHSTWQEAVAVARAAAVGRLVVTHLAPDDTDEVLAARELRLRAACPNACLGRQGLRLPWTKG